MIDLSTTIIIIGVFLVIMLLLSLLRRSAQGMDAFLVANRTVGIGTGAMSVAATWIWAPALFVAAQKAYVQGVPGLLWFTVPNILSLLIFGCLATRIRQVFAQGYTLPQYMGKLFGAPTHLIYFLAFLFLQICSLAVQLIAGASLLTALTGLPYSLGVVLLTLLFTSYSVIDGLRSSIITDFLQMILIIGGLVVLTPLVIYRGGIDSILQGMSGVSGQYGNPFDLYVAYSFGITVTIGLISGPVGDQQHWQRAFAFADGKVFRGYVWAATLFSLVPVTMGLLGFMAAGYPGIAGTIIDTQQAGLMVIQVLIPGWGIALFVIMLLAGLASTGDSALCAGSSLVSIDIYHTYINPQATPETTLVVARMAIIGIAATAVCIALIPGITILKLFLFYGTLRSTTLVPTILALFYRRLTAQGMFWSIVIALAFGLPTYLLGEFWDNVQLKVIANIGILLISLVIPLIFKQSQKT